MKSVQCSAHLKIVYAKQVHQNIIIMLNRNDFNFVPLSLIINCMVECLSFFASREKARREFYFPVRRCFIYSTLSKPVSTRLLSWACQFVCHRTVRETFDIPFSSLACEMEQKEWQEKSKVEATIWLCADDDDDVAEL